MTAVTVYSTTLLIWLVPGLGKNLVPVLVYVTAITVMCITAGIASLADRRVMIGAVLFLLSDSLIAIGKFKFHLPLDAYAVWATYYAGQYLIATGILEAARAVR